MAIDRSPKRIRNGYALLLRLYPNSFYRRFGDQMEQTFSDLLREHIAVQRSLFGFVLRVYIETLAGAIVENMAVFTSRYRALKSILLVTALILLAPLLAMRFTDDVNWNFADFAAAGMLLIGAGLAFERLARKVSSKAYHAAAAIAVATALLLIWAILAVGVIGNENNPANLIYLTVLVVGLTGSVIVRRRPDGMARTLFAMAVVQTQIGVVAHVNGLDHSTTITALFVVLWLSSAWLFLRSHASPATKI